MNFVDGAVLVAVLITALRGYRLGIVRELFGFAGWAIGALAALRYTFAWVPTLSPATGVPPALMGLLIFVAIFAGAYIGCRLLGWLVTRAIDATFLGSVNATLGMALGIIEGVVLSAGLLYLLQTSKLVPWVLPKIETSVLAPPMVEAAGDVVRRAKNLETSLPGAKTKDEKARSEKASPSPTTPEGAAPQ